MLPELSTLPAAGAKPYAPPVLDVLPPSADMLIEPPILRATAAMEETLNSPEVAATKFPPVVVKLAAAPVVVVLITARLDISTPPPLPDVAKSVPRVIVGFVVPTPLIVPPVPSKTT